MKNDSTKTDTNREPTELDTKELANVNGGYESQAWQDYVTWYHQQGPGKQS